MNKLFLLFPAAIILFSFNHPFTEQRIPVKISDTIIDNVSKVKIIKGWGEFIYKDTLYTLTFTGNKDSVKLFQPIIGPGGTIFNMQNGNFGFIITKDVDSTFINISKSGYSISTRQYLTKKFMTFKIRVKK